jgi:hypothetical protein
MKMSNTKAFVNATCVVVQTLLDHLPTPIAIILFALCQEYYLLRNYRNSHKWLAVDSM